MKAYESYLEVQRHFAKKHSGQYQDCQGHLKIGVALKSFEVGSMYPIHGLRHPQSNGTAGWFIWSGEYSDDKDFFDPIHVEHCVEKFPELIKFLALPPAYRFLIGKDGYEDVWADESLLNL